jgi:hypothetical protein
MKKPAKKKPRKGSTGTHSTNFVEGRVYLVKPRRGGVNRVGESTGIALPATDLGPAPMYVNIANFDVVIWDGRMTAGCEAMTRRETDRLFRKFARALGYTVAK